MDIDEVLEFLQASVSPFHASDRIEASLRRAGFTRLEESEPFELEPAAGYYVRRGETSIVAFRPGNAAPWEAGCALAGAHLDSPSLRLKYPAAAESEGYSVLPVEVYGGPILSTWLDRSLGIAGRVVVRSDGGMGSVLVRSDAAIATIPNSAIHLNRDVNKGFEYNAQDHLGVVLGSTDADLPTLLGSLASVERSNIIDADIYLYEDARPVVFGADGEFYSAGRIDNLVGCYTILRGFLASPAAEHTQMAWFFDNEEVGSRTPMGADSGFLTTVMNRVVLARGGSIEHAYAARARSFLLSNDGAHAVHPSFAAKHDPNFKPVLNGGPVVKIHAGRRYASDSVSISRFSELCEAAGVPFQRYYNRSDARSGSTIGPIASSLGEMSAVDVGVPMLAMHSIREVAGSKDAGHMSAVIGRFFTEGP